MRRDETIVFWQNGVSIHQGPLLRALAERSDGRVVVITESDIPRSRVQQGWHRPDYGRAEVVIAPGPEERARLNARLSESGVHIFSGMGAYPATTASMMAVLARGTCTVGLFVEPWDPTGWRGRVRWLKYRRLAWRLRDQIDFVLTTGPLGRRQYTRLGFPTSRVHPFGYFVQELTDTLPPAHPGPAGGPVRFAFVGSMNPGKQPLLLLDALARCGARDWTLDMVGDGPLRDRLISHARRLNLHPRVTWHGALANNAARRLIATSDVLVLPSRYDGWGAVVGEALLAGTRVVVSDRCGAQDLVVSDRQGRIVDSRDGSALTAALSAEIHYGRISPEDRASRAAWAAEHISADRGATYLLDLVAHVRDGCPAPAPPWHGSGADAAVA